MHTRTRTHARTHQLQFSDVIGDASQNTGGQRLGQAVFAEQLAHQAQLPVHQSGPVRDLLCKGSHLLLQLPDNLGV